MHPPAYLMVQQYLERPQPDIVPSSTLMRQLVADEPQQRLLLSVGQQRNLWDKIAGAAPTRRLDVQATIT